MSPIHRQVYQQNAEGVEKLHSAIQICYWTAGLAIPAAILLEAALWLSPYITLPTLFVAAGGLWYNREQTFIRAPDFMCKCGGVTTIRFPWVCGFCGVTHPRYKFNLKKHSLADPCRKCGKRQHSILCWQCREPIIWDESAFTEKTSAWHPECPPVERKKTANFDDRRRRSRIR